MRSLSLLEIKDLKTYFDTDRGLVKAVEGVTFNIDPGETVGVVGESGCGKSVTALSVMKLLPKPVGRIAGGKIIFKGEDLTDATEDRMRQIRGNKISMIFQEPMTSLNPVLTVGYQIMEPLMLHQGMSSREAKAKTIEMLQLVGMPDPGRRVDEYPHQLSGGQRQRAMIAMALACRPELLIADEPTTALDVTIQAQILDLMNDLQREFDTAIMLITHDLGVIAEMAQRVVVMYAGLIVEEAPVVPLFYEPLHPYTRGLLSSIPRVDKDLDKLHVIPGFVPSPFEFPKGCRFHNRCDRALSKCSEEMPPLYVFKDGRAVRCFLYESKSTDRGASR